jgi:hypothetical protein
LTLVGLLPPLQCDSTEWGGGNHGSTKHQGARGAKMKGRAFVF